MQSFADWVQFAVSSAVVVLFLLILLSLIILITRRGKKEGGQKIAIEKLNKTWLENEDSIRQAFLSEKEFSKLLKERQKAEKKTDAEGPSKRNVFVIDFSGDIGASATSTLREQVSALIGVMKSGDEVVVRLESTGGVVHGYGLAASQLARLTESNLPVTVCVDKVAASGGYMMACVASKIVAAPFAFIGSIGVISSMPNFSRLLKKNDVDFVEQTAGEFKRTVSLFGELNDSKKAKHQKDLEAIHLLFKEHISRFRPRLDINAVSTGEVWLGRTAFELGLVDEIRTSDDLLMDLAGRADVYVLKSEQETNWKTKLKKQFFSQLSELNMPLAKITDRFC